MKSKSVSTHRTSAAGVAGVICDEVALLPCPFCGGEAELYDEKDLGDWVFCTTVDCGANGGGAFTPEAWNRRAERDELAGALRRLLRGVEREVEDLDLFCDELAEAVNDARAVLARMNASHSEMTPAHAQNAGTVKQKQDLA